MRGTAVPTCTLLGLIFLMSACGSVPAAPGVANIGAKPSTTVGASAPSSGGFPDLQKAYQAQLSYSECMWSHGVPGYPDPVLSGHGLSMSSGKLDVSSPQFVSAATACKKLVPNGGPPTQAQIQATINAALKHSECMRAHGVPNFPDPVVSSHSISISIGGPGVDPNSPQFQAAQRICARLAPLGGAG
jgi:hypothetical protein